MQNQKENKVKTFKIPPLHTYMIKETDGASIDELKLSLLSGQAQILGMQLKRHYPLKINMPCIVLVFTWSGCEIQAEWPQEKNGKSSEQWIDITLNNHTTQSPMQKYLKVHMQLSMARKLAMEKYQKGPRIAIVGGQNSGVAYSSRLLLTWAGKLNMKPIYVDLDLQNSLFLNGAVGTCVYEYKVSPNDDLYKHCQKLCMVYGNRKIRTASFLNTARRLAGIVNSRVKREMMDVKWKGTKEEICSFASGIVLKCPRISDDKKNLKEMLAQLFTIFDITHVLIIDNPDLSSFISRNCPHIHKEVVPKIQGIDFLMKLLPQSTKIKDYIQDKNLFQEEMLLQEVTLYEIIEQDNMSPFVRIIDIETEHVNKTGVAIIDEQRGSLDEDPELTAQRILQGVILEAMRISRIGDKHVAFDVKKKGSVQNYKNKIWVSMIAEKYV